MKLGFIGLGKMGKNMVLHLLEQGVEVVAWNRSPEPLEEVVKAGAIEANDIGDLIKKIDSSPSAQNDTSRTSVSLGDDNVGKIVWLMLPAGEVTDEFIDQVLPLLKPGDLLIDGANSFYKDTLRRAEKILPTGVHFMDIGVSGGPAGARSGACLMIGGIKEDYSRIKELVEKIAAKDAYGHFGGLGAGHFAKMVHNGIEYGMMEAISEGGAILKSSQFNINMVEVFKVYNNRSVIESRLVGWTLEALEEDQNLSDYSSKIGHTGEGEWTIKTAKELKVEVPVIEESYKVRVESENLAEESNNQNEPKALSSLRFRNRMTSAMRGKFGQHSVKKN